MCGERAGFVELFENGSTRGSWVTVVMLSPGIGQNDSPLPRKRTGRCHRPTIRMNFPSGVRSLYVHREDLGLYEQRKTFRHRIHPSWRPQVVHYPSGKNGQRGGLALGKLRRGRRANPALWPRKSAENQQADGGEIRCGERQMAAGKLKSGGGRGIEHGSKHAACPAPFATVSGWMMTA